MITLIIIGVDHWDDYTRPFIDSVRAVEPSLNIVCVDNGSNTPYPETEGVDILRLPHVLCYAAGINRGMAHAPASDWYLIANNDLLIHKQFTKRFETLDKRTLYGFMEYNNDKALPHVRYLSGWLLFVSNVIYNTIGGFDEAFKPMFFEDADYCHRALKAGFALQSLDRNAWGIKHLEDERSKERRVYMEKYQQQRSRNREYFFGKHSIK